MVAGASDDLSGVSGADLLPGLVEALANLFDILPGLLVFWASLKPGLPGTPVFFTYRFVGQGRKPVRCLAQDIVWWQFGVGHSAHRLVVADFNQHAFEHGLGHVVLDSAFGDLKLCCDLLVGESVELRQHKGRCNSLGQTL